MLQKFVVEVSQLAKMTVIGCTREPIFADFGKFVNFLKFRSDTVIDLSIMSGSTAAVGVDGKMSLKSCQVLELFRLYCCRAKFEAIIAAMFYIIFDFSIGF